MNGGDSRDNEMMIYCGRISVFGSNLLVHIGIIIKKH